MKNHPERSELIRAARTVSSGFAEHLSSCEWCRDFCELLRVYHVAGALPLADAPQYLIEKALAVSQRAGVGRKLKSLAAKLIFDSWSMPLPAGVRSEGLLQERRIRFEISDKTLDLRAEHRQNHWDFVARVTDSQGEAVDCTLIAGKKELTVNEDGFYQWSSVRPPAKFKLRTGQNELETPELSWKKSPAD
jgi:hypothetical protein